MTAPVSYRFAGTRWLATFGALARFLFHTLRSWSTLPRAGRGVVQRVFAAQVWFTAVQAIPLVFVLSSIISFLLISQAIGELGRIGATEYIGQLMVIIVVRELGPLLTALTVGSRSGTAVAAELATNKVMGEIDALEGMGIDPTHYLVLPRFAATVVSVFGLILIFDFIALTAGLAGAVSQGMAPERYFNIVLQNLSFQDAWLTLAKGLVFGTILGIVPSYYGLRARGVATDVPIAASRTVVVSIVSIFICSALFVIAVGIR